MNNVWKRIGWGSMSVLPLIASLFLQTIMGILLLPIIFIVSIKLGNLGITDPAEIQRLVTVIINDMGWLLVLAYHIISLPVFGLWYYYGCGRPKPARISKVFNIKSIMTLIMVGFSMSIFANGFLLTMQFMAPKIFQRYVELMEMSGLGDHLAINIAAVIIAPFGEEILCRGLIFYYARKATFGMNNQKAAFWIANVIQALMFGIMHLNILQGSYAFIMGLGFGWLYKKYNSLYPCIFVHFVVNFLAVYITEHILGPIPNNMLSAILILLAGIAIFVFATFIDSKNKQNKKESLIV